MFSCVCMYVQQEQKYEEGGFVGGKTTEEVSQVDLEIRARHLSLSSDSLGQEFNLSQRGYPHNTVFIIMKPESEDQKPSLGIYFWTECPL